MIVTNADLAQHATSALDRYREMEQSIEVQLDGLQLRLEMVREFIDALSGKTPPKRGRPRIVGQHVPKAGPPIADQDGPLPSELERA